jgi:hypothetical protein
MNRHDRTGKQIREKDDDDRVIDAFIYWICGILLAAVLLGMFNDARACDQDCQNMRQFQFQAEQQHQLMIQQQQIQDMRNAQIQQQLDSYRVIMPGERRLDYAPLNRPIHRPY